MATLPKPRYPAFGSGEPGVWPPPLRPWENRERVVSASSSLLGLQAQAPVLASEPVVPEAGLALILSARLRRLGRFLSALAGWWMEADFRNRQVPVLLVALGLWGMTARGAWQSQESATPFLRQSISFLHQEQQARAAVNGSVAPSGEANRVEPAAPSQREVTNAPPAVTPAHAGVPNPARASSGNLVTLLAASLDSLFDAQPARAEKIAGNPRRHVWVDLKTGLYYCPGAAYYGFGGRSRGKVMPQKDAEYEYFQPAAGAACQ